MTAVQLLAVLRELEWIWVEPPPGAAGLGSRACPSCEERAAVHAVDCRLAAAIRALEHEGIAGADGGSRDTDLPGPAPVITWPRPLDVRSP